MAPITTPTTAAEMPRSPPAAHTCPKALVTEQPTSAPTMSPSRERFNVEEGKAARLRGGCIPCPDGGCCYIIPIPCCC
ncbi:hypothetical protein C8R46DRAFT_1139474 [Mycena filopes]|nr:hypothetical protein C8R46DRAFT_1139474 [Mycena filopes]